MERDVQGGEFLKQTTRWVSQFTANRRGPWGDRVETILNIWVHVLDNMKIIKEMDFGPRLILKKNVLVL